MDALHRHILFRPQWIISGRSALKSEVHSVAAVGQRIACGRIGQTSLVLEKRSGDSAISSALLGTDDSYKDS